MSSAPPDESQPLSLAPQDSSAIISMSFDDPAVTEGLLAEMEEKEEQLLHAAEFGQALLQRTEELQDENETITRIAEEHEYRARELQKSLDALAEEATNKEAELEAARLSLSVREQEVEARLKQLEGTQAEKEAMVVEIQEEAEAAKSEAAEEIARLKAQQAEILASETQMREAREEEERQRIALQKKQRETEERMARYEEQQAKRESTMRRAARQLEKEREEKQRLQAELAEAEERRARESRDLLLRSTAEFHELRRQLAKPGQVFSPDGTPISNVEVPDSPSLHDAVERQLSSERHRNELSEYATRNRELERKLREASSAPPASPDVHVGLEPEPEPESGPGSVLDQAKACIRHGDKHMSLYETEAAVEQYDAGLQLIGAKPDPRLRETTPLFDFAPQGGDDVAIFDSVPSQDGETPASTSLQVGRSSSAEDGSGDTTSPAIAAVQAELEEKRNRAMDLLRRKEDEFRVRILLDKGRDRMRSKQYSSALSALREGLQCCSDQPHGVFRDMREELRTLEAEAAEACDEQKQRRRQERQRVQEATKSGYLQKKGEKFKNFKKRFFVLECCKSPGDPGSSRIE